MKKLLFVIVAAIAFVACEKEPFVQANDFTERELSNKVSLNQALVYAENSINGIGTSTRSTSRKVKSTEIFVAKPSTRNVESEEVSFYLINYENNEGYAMVSTDSRTTPVYAYSDEGNLNPEDFENNPGLKIFLEGAILNYEDEIANCSTYALGDGDRLPIFEIPDILYETNDIVEIVEENGTYYYKGYKTTVESLKEAMVPVAWHQHLPFGRLFTVTKKAGCGPVAVGQVMAYHQYPTIHNGKIYNWQQMLSVPSNIGVTEIDEADNIANLLYEIADKASFSYQGDDTITSTSNLKVALEYFNYTCQGVISFNETTAINSIYNNKPIIVSGGNSGGSVGHTWVIDGHKTVRQTISFYYTRFPYNLYRDSYTEAEYYHCNWGWSPTLDPTYYRSNGFYLRNSFNYNLYLYMIYNISPQSN